MKLKYTISFLIVLFISVVFFSRDNFQGHNHSHTNNNLFKKIKKIHVRII